MSRETVVKCDICKAQQVNEAQFYIEHYRLNFCKAQTDNRSGPIYNSWDICSVCLEEMAGLINERVSAFILSKKEPNHVK